MKTLPIILTGLLALSGCSSNKLATSGVEDLAKQQAMKSTMTPGQAVDEARKSIEQAVNDNLAFFTPLHFKNAQDTLAYVEKLQNGEEKPKDMSTELAIITESFKAKELINAAYKTKVLIEQTLADSLAHKAVLDELEVKKDYPKTYAERVEELVDLFQLVEQNKVEDARKEQPDLLNAMARLEINTLIKRNVSPAQLVLDKAEDNDADDYAELTFEQAEKAIARAKSFINQNYRDREQVVLVGKEALVAAQRALHIGLESQSMVKLDEEQAEQKALEMESMIKVIRTAMDASEIEGLSIQEQAAKLAALATLGYQAPAGSDDEAVASTESKGDNDSVITPLNSSFMKPFDDKSELESVESAQLSAETDMSESEVTEPKATIGESETIQDSAEPQNKAINEEPSEI